GCAREPTQKGARGGREEAPEVADQNEKQPDQAQATEENLARKVVGSSRELRPSVHRSRGRTSAAIHAGARTSCCARTLRPRRSRRCASRPGETDGDMERHTVRQYLIAERPADTRGITVHRELLLCAAGPTSSECCPSSRGSA